MVSVEAKAAKLICISLKNQLHLKEIWRKVKKSENDEHEFVLQNFPSMRYNINFPKCLSRINKNAYHRRCTSKI